MVRKEIEPIMQQTVRQEMNAELPKWMEKILMESEGLSGMIKDQVSFTQAPLAAVIKHLMDHLLRTNERSAQKDELVTRNIKELKEMVTETMAATRENFT